MDFGTITLKNLSDPQPSYEYTRKTLVDSINEYVESTILSNVGKALFGFTGTVEFPPYSPVPYIVPPLVGTDMGGLVSGIPGKATFIDYDKVAEYARSDMNNFWPRFFELIGRTFYRSVLTIAPLIPLAPGDPSFSTPMIYSSEVLTGSASFFRVMGDKFIVSKPLNGWKRTGEEFRKFLFQQKVQSRDVLWPMVAKFVKRAAEENGFLWRQYTGSVRRRTDAYPGILTGHIIGRLNYD